MKLIVGLGNPGKEYEQTRHNAGFLAIDKLAEMLGVSLTTKKFNALIGVFQSNDEKIILMKPQTFMNSSGEAVIQCLNFYKMNPEDIIVVHDDLDLPIGKIRIREQGSAAGQRGMGNIIQHTKTQEIKRIRIGIGHDPFIPVVDYVLGKTKKEDLPLYLESIEKVANALKFSINNPFTTVMNRFN